MFNLLLTATQFENLKSFLLFCIRYGNLQGIELIDCDWVSDIPKTVQSNLLEAWNSLFILSVKDFHTPIEF